MCLEMSLSRYSSIIKKYHAVVLYYNLMKLFMARRHYIYIIYTIRNLKQKCKSQIYILHDLIHFLNTISSFLLFKNQKISRQHLINYRHINQVVIIGHIIYTQQAGQVKKVLIFICPRDYFKQILQRYYFLCK